MANSLINEQSSYLLQHADNPVDWHPWGEAAFALARKQDKPVLLSIGYSSCHWCHVMAHESFENDYIAGLMNSHFVCIKVDREERPDVDQIYMQAVQMMHGHGGWPLHAFCLPDGRPFTGGTYFPPEDRGQGLIPWPQLLMRIADFYRRDKKRLEENAEAIMGNMGSGVSGLTLDIIPATTTAADLADSLLKAVNLICSTHDDVNGGFGGAPKFPPAQTLGFLMEMHQTRLLASSQPDMVGRIEAVVNTTLGKMARGGLYDQIGGGFARYSVDERWAIPHFEKMLYDNALLLTAYTRGWLLTRNPLYGAIIEETVAWLSREMMHPDRAFFASLDADVGGQEGATYLWSKNEINLILGQDEGELFCQHYNITETGNFENGLSHPALQTDDFEIRSRLASSRLKLLHHRKRRKQPGCDQKHVTSWNSLVVSGLADAGYYLNKPEWLGIAVRVADWIWETACDKDGRLSSVCYESRAGVAGFLDDYVFLAEAFFTLGGKADWIQPGASNRFFKRAIQLLDHVIDHFKDTGGIDSGYYYTADDHEQLICRRKEWFDGALPSGQAVLLHALSLANTVDPQNRKWERELNHLLGAFRLILNEAPAGIPHALTGIVSELSGTGYIKVGPDGDLEALRRAVSARPWRRILISKVEPESPEMDLLSGKAYQLCIKNTCTPPTDVVADLVMKL